MLFVENVEEILKFGRDHHVPVLRDESTEFFLNKVKQISPKTILEIGTAIGYSGSLMLSACPDSTLDTIEKNEQSYLIAKQNFADLGFGDRAHLFLGDGLEVCKSLREMGKKYDLIFLDGPKGQYIYYLDVLLDMLTPCGVLLCDNFLFQGLVRSDVDVGHKKRAMITKLRRFLHEIETRQDIITIVHENGDGIAEIRKK